MRILEVVGIDGPSISISCAGDVRGTGGVRCLIQSIARYRLSNFALRLSAVHGIFWTPKVRGDIPRLRPEHNGVFPCATAYRSLQRLQVFS